MGGSFTTPSEPLTELGRIQMTDPHKSFAPIHLQEVGPTDLGELDVLLDADDLAVGGLVSCEEDQLKVPDADGIIFSWLPAREDGHGRSDLASVRRVVDQATELSESFLDRGHVPGVRARDGLRGS